MLYTLRMRRRTLLGSLLAAVGLAPAVRIDLRGAAAQAPPAGLDVATLRAIAEVVLPAALGTAGHAAAVDRFVRWHGGYREGADRGHGYGASTLAAPAPAAPAGRYPSQFAALDQAARAEGGASFAALPFDARRRVVEAALNAPTRVTTLPARPSGANLVADFLGYYVNSAAAFDLAYDAAIGRDACRSLDGSDQPPRPLRSA